MAADYTVIAAAHPESAASEVIADAGFLASPTVDDVTDALERTTDYLGSCLVAVDATR
ncbi:hypothetical protein Htur_1237 [Haloterrigena turkmenica DSM 5511]|uniref:Uncharacterized protein n=1 Tax=Haloterrigena turkmenica (strain ATCC 51198 / DSM 5511 / JCM 9101 / NCIMB 13204 / VKM B-1734 / 4k) TaxID=543526 RepID=D2RP94_HALTV|nr:hypothetical protein [Haloterrigena turkmenica]ADB60128.1 hypothetical protein Htur_1237 [Haloterrigena turkmenica DSM 5511]